MRSIIVTVATMIANIHIMSNKLRSMYNVEQKQHAGKTTEPFYKTICYSVVHSDTREREAMWAVCMCVLCFMPVYTYGMCPVYLNGQGSYPSSTF